MDKASGSSARHCSRSNSDQFYVKFEVPGTQPQDPLEDISTDRQARLEGFSQERFANATVLLVGAGGLNGPIGVGLAREGIGRTKIFDHDVVHLSNLSRQKFYIEDLYHNKALCLARNLAREAVSPVVIEGHARSFEEAIEAGIDLSADVVINGTDNDAVRVATSRAYPRTPVIFLAVAENCDNGYVFVQEPSGPCFGCLFPEALVEDPNRRFPCKVPAILDINTVLAGLALYAVRTLLSEAPRNWNYWEIFVDGSIPARPRVVTRRADCPACSTWRICP
ncbi:ThiF family adenylyltransferase [Candidatus Micrarchaeota archaeon]|nr:ThiF family adenylyltransferase [Candidatus Micrarchaeota archaeon]